MDMRACGVRHEKVHQHACAHTVAKERASNDARVDQMKWMLAAEKFAEEDSDGDEQPKKEEAAQLEAAEPQQKLPRRLAEGSHKLPGAFRSTP